MHKNFHNNLQVPPIQGEANPIMLQALVATHTQSMTGSSKDTLMQAASKKRKQMNETMSGSVIKQSKIAADPLTSRSVHDNVHTFL